MSLAEALDILAAYPEETWDVNDDACDCTFQRVGFWTNPYIGETLEVRMCCIWEELYKLFPQFVRKTPAFQNYVTGEWEGPREWDGERDMPRSIWYRQLRHRTGRDLADIREEFRVDEPPKGTPKPEVESGPSLITLLYAQVLNLKRRVDELEAK